MFTRKLDAQRHLNNIEHQKATGGYVDPAAGKVTFRSYAEEWAGRQVWRPSTADAFAAAFARVFPVIGDRPVAQLRLSELQSLVKALSATLAPATVEATHRAVAAVLRAAVVDRVLSSSPAVGVKLPRVDRPKVQPLDLDQVLALAEAMPDLARATVLFAAGSGLRMGETLGLSVDRVDFLRRTVRVDRQMVTPSSGEPGFGPPKTPSSRRTVPLAQVTLDVLAAHLARFPAVDGLVFTSSHRQPWRRGTFAELIRQAREDAGLPAK